MRTEREALVTVVVPTRNRAALLGHTLDAVLAQRDVELEVVVVDEASTDATPELLAALDDPRIRVIRHDRPRGVSMARNAGTAAARTPWVAWCDDDDLWAPDKLAAQLAAARSLPDAGWVVVGDVTVDEHLRPANVDLPPPPDRMVELLGHNVVPGGGSGVVARRELVHELGGFDPSLSITADWELWIRLWAAAPCAVVARPLVAYRRHVGGMSGRNIGFERELRHLLASHERLRRAAGVDVDRAELEEWRSVMHLLGGRRYRAAARSLAAAACGRRIRHHLSWAGWSLLDAQRLRDRLADVGRRHLAPWADEIDTWLGPLAARTRG